MLFFLQNVVAVSATLLTAPLAARSHVCVLFGHSHTLPAIQDRMDSPLDLESPPQRMASLAVFLRGYAIAATGVPPHTTSHDRVTRDGPLRHN